LPLVAAQRQALLAAQAPLWAASRLLAAAQQNQPQV